MSLTNIAAEAIGGNMDVISDILVRLPAKTVTRFKLVSKQWFSNISDPKFVHRHSLWRPNKIPTGMFLFEPREDGPRPNEINFVSFKDVSSSPITPSLSFLNDVGRGAQIKIRHSCNGLLLCLVTTRTKKSMWDHYCVCNPSTRKYRVVLKVPHGRSHDVVLAFEPSVSPYYKVYMMLRSKGQCLIDIYSSEDQSVKPYIFPHEPPNRGLFLYGAICWIDLRHAICLDVKSNTMHHFMMPRDNEFYICSYLLGSGNRLYRTDIIGSLADSFPIYEITSSCAKWVPKHEIMVVPIMSLFPQIVRLDMLELAPLFIVDGLKEEDSALVLAIPGKIIWYNLMHKTVKEISDYHGYPIDPFSVSTVRALEFIESLSFV